MPRRNKQPRSPRQQPAGCGDKKRYQSRDKARAVIEDRVNLIDDDVKLDTYRCSVCQGWHLTSVK